MDKEIKKQLCNTIALFGGKDDIVSIINDIDNISEKELLERLKNWNRQKVDEIKNRLDRQSSRSVTVTQLS